MVMSFGAAEEDILDSWHNAELELRILRSWQRAVCDIYGYDVDEPGAAQEVLTYLPAWKGEAAAHAEMVESLLEIHTRRDDDPYILGPTCRRCNQSWPCATAAVLGKRD